LKQGCQVFLGTTYIGTKIEKYIHHFTKEYTQWPQNIPDGHNIYHHFPFKGPPKYTQLGLWYANIISGNPDWKT
jgi:hypothetical protein